MVGSFSKPIDIYQEAADCQDMTRKKELHKSALQCEAKRKVHDMLGVAALSEPICVSIEDFDGDAHLINCKMASRENGRVERLEPTAAVPEGGRLDGELELRQRHHPGRERRIDQRSVCLLWFG
jgi:hypothetical protein